MKKIKMNWWTSNSIYDMYQNNGISFCWAAPVKPREYKQVSVVDNCRELFSYRLRQFLHPATQTDFKQKDSDPFNINRFFFCAITKNKHWTSKFTREWVIEAQRVINIFEKNLGWGLTKVYNIESKTPFVETYLFSASAKWLRAPQLISLYLLLLRLGVNKSIKQFKNLDDLENTIKTFKTLMLQKKVSEHLMTDMNYLIRIKDYIPMILKNVNSLFFCQKVEENYRNCNSYEGICNLVERGAPNNKKLDNTFRKLILDARGLKNEK